MSRRAPLPTPGAGSTSPCTALQARPVWRSLRRPCAVFMEIEEEDQVGKELGVESGSGCTTTAVLYHFHAHLKRKNCNAPNIYLTYATILCQESKVCLTKQINSRIVRLAIEPKQGGGTTREAFSSLRECKRTSFYNDRMRASSPEELRWRP